MYGRVRAGDCAECWTEPAGLVDSTGITPELAQKMINKSMSHINKFVETHMTNMGAVGSWSQDQIDSIVLPTSGGMDEDIVEEINDVDIDNDMIDEIDV